MTQTAVVEATALRTMGGWTDFDRFIGTCKACKTTFAVTIPGSLFGKEVRPCPSCATVTAVSQVFGAVSEGKRCDARCLNAKRSSCECQCGGKNHGGGR